MKSTKRSSKEGYYFFGYSDNSHVLVSLQEDEIRTYNTRIELETHWLAAKSLYYESNYIPFPKNQDNEA